MACVTDLLKGIQASCNAIKKVGGLDKRIYLGLVADIATITFGASDANSILTLTFNDDKGLTQWIGKRDKNSAGVELEVGENVNIRTQSVTPIIYYETAAELSYLDNLLDQEGVFAIVETVAGSLEVFGINKVNFDSFGLKASALSMVSGVLLNDSTAATLTLSGGMTNLQLQYVPASPLATNIAALDALSVDPVPAP